MVPAAWELNGEGENDDSTERLHGDLRTRRKRVLGRPREDHRGLPYQGRTINQARDRIREALTLFDDQAERAKLVDDVRLPSDVHRLVHAQRSTRLRQGALRAELHALNVKAARALTQRVGLSLRDAGELLGASQESVRQWVEAS